MQQVVRIEHCCCIWVSDGENGQIPPFCKICSKKALFHNLLVIYHFSSTRVCKHCCCIWVFDGENGQIPPFCKICSKKALFHNLLVIYHFSSTRVLQTRVLNGTRVYET